VIEQQTDDDPKLSEKQSSKTKTRLKKLGVERVYYRRPTTHAIMVARINGNVSEIALQKSLQNLQWKHLLLSCSIQIDSEQVAWFEFDSTLEPNLEVRVRSSDDDWLAVMAEEHTFLFDLEKGPLIRYILLWSKDKSDLVINCHHSICDGTSLYTLIEDIMECLEGKVVRETIDAPPISELVPPDRRKVGLIRKLVIGLLNRIWSRNEHLFSDQDFEKLHRVYWDTNQPLVRSYILDEKEVKKLVTKCHEYDVTVHTAICTAFVKAQAEIQGTKEDFRKYTHMPVNLRERLTGQIDKAFGFYATAIIAELELEPNLTFWDSASRLHGIIRACLDNDAQLFRLFQMGILHPTLLDSTYFTRFNLFKNKISRIVANSMGLDGLIAGIAITNLGKKTLEKKNGQLELESIFGPSVYTDIIEKVISVITLNGCMYITVTFDKNQVEEKVVELVTGKALSFLREEI